jgi:hypothetical protein
VEVRGDYANTRVLRHWDALNFMPRDGGGWALEDVHRDIYALLVDGEVDVELHPALFDRITRELSDMIRQSDD